MIAHALQIHRARRKIANSMSHFHRRVLLGIDERIDLAQSLTEIAIGLNGFWYKIIEFCFFIVLNSIDLSTNAVKKMLEKAHYDLIK